MKLKDLVHFIDHAFVSMLQEHGFIHIKVKAPTQTIVFRKVLDPWFIFINFQYSRWSTQNAQLLIVQTMRLMVDEPYLVNIRDKQGLYRPGSLVGNVSPENSIGWEYHTLEELTLLTEPLLAALKAEIQRLEDLSVSMNYD